MRLVSYLLSGKVRLGAMLGDSILDVSRAHREMLSASPSRGPAMKPVRPLPSEMLSFLQRGPQAMAAARQAARLIQRQLQNGTEARFLRQGILVPLSKARIVAPVPRPPKLIAVWVNYAEHGAEAAIQAPKKTPVFFTKFPTAVIGPGQPIVLPRISRKVDYEAELALVIGTRGKHVPPEKAYDYIAGYTILNDVSARDFSLRELLGVVGPSDIQKSFDTFAPMGPWLVTADEIPDPHSLRIRLSIGNELLQDDNTGHMIHRIPEIVSYLSAVATLEPGDVITTGTPPGVGFTRTPPRWLRAGETVRIEIEKIGVLENPVVAETPA